MARLMPLLRSLALAFSGPRCFEYLAYAVGGVCDLHSTSSSKSRAMMVSETQARFSSPAENVTLQLFNVPLLLAPVDIWPLWRSPITGTSLTTYRAIGAGHVLRPVLVERLGMGRRGCSVVRPPAVDPVWGVRPAAAR